MALFSNILAASMSVIAAEPVNCEARFSPLADTIEDVYVGYAMEVASNPSALAAYQDRRSGYSEQARQLEAGSLACTRLLKGFVQSFEDPHLFLNPSPQWDAESQSQFRQNAPRRELGDPDTWRAEAIANAGIHPLIGVWQARTMVVAILPSETGVFEAVVLSSETEEWSPGDIRAQFEPRGTYTEALVFRSSDRAPIMLKADVERDVILHIAPLSWGRLEPLTQADARVFDPSNPRAPTYDEVQPGVGWLAIPSFAPEYESAFAAISRDHRRQIEESELLIIDLRSNEGGSTGMGRFLEPWYLSEDPSPNERTELTMLDAPHILSSEPTVRYFEGRVEQRPFWARGEARDLVRRLQANPGQLVPQTADLDALADLLESREPDSEPAPGPNQVAVIVDRHVVSAGEAVLLRMAQSDRVTVFGENTAGSIDYQSVLIIQLGEGPYRVSLGFPTIAAHGHLPEGGYNAEGVPVDIPLSGPQATWIDGVLAHYDQD